MSDLERDIDAGERALGLVSRDGEDQEGRALREAWERRFAPLLDAVDPVDPPAGLFDRIERQLDHDDTVVELATLRRKLGRWRGAAAVAASAAAALLLWIAIPTTQTPARYVAVVTADADGTAGMVIEFDTGTGVATVVPVGIEPPEGRAVEMWHLPAGADRPYSLGLMPDGPEILRGIETGPGDVIGVSFEPPGGSPTGQPTDARFHGTIIQVE